MGIFRPDNILSQSSSCVKVGDLYVCEAVCRWECDGTVATISTQHKSSNRRLAVEGAEKSIKAAITGEILS